MDSQPPKAFIFMKVKDYEEETLEGIVERKQRELNDVGMTYWGYGGTILDPTKQVQPFVGRWFSDQEPIYLLMHRTKGKFKSGASPAKANQFSEDKKDKKSWKDVRSGIHLPRTKCALVIDEIVELTPPQELNLRDYEVGIGPSCGDSAAEYQKRSGKGCFVLAETVCDGPDDDGKYRACISYRIRLKRPYAVYIQ